ncbi:MAG: DUF2752 domain-containing protein [Phycisphaerae bacterium]|jgi:hypothetical protein|nr:DUF2752 domain-containing protein [Phycisphaerae bacterium]
MTNKSKWFDPFSRFRAGKLTTSWFYKSTKQDRITFLAVFVMIVFIFVLFYVVKAGLLNLGPGGGCAFERNFGLPCPTCGWTRAINAFMDGKIIKAFYVQPGAAAFCLILAWTAFFSLLSAASGVNFSFLPPVRLWQLKHILLTIITILAAGWAVTLARALAQMR